MNKVELSCRYNGQLRLYIHIPFCVSKCYYCDFYSRVGSDEEQKKYVCDLINEIEEEAIKYKKREVASIFIGGGTPSILHADYMKQVMDVLYRNFQVRSDAEISIEMNPKTKTKEKLQAYIAMGINRLSIGMQTTIDEELSSLGRCHTYREFLDTFSNAREVGFNNINVDIMEAIPGQTLESYKDTLKRVCELGPEHISSYSLILEEGTKFYDWYVSNSAQNAKSKKELPSEEVERMMYEETETILNAYGYSRYEISNYAKVGKECKHNIGYWTGDDYLGFGTSAASMVDHTRWTNGLEEKHCLSIVERMEEFMFLGLRLMDGVSYKDFEKQFKKSMDEIYGDKICKMQEQGLLFTKNKEHLCLTKKGIDLSNYVFSQFLQNVIKK